MNPFVSTALSSLAQYILPERCALCGISQIPPIPDTIPVCSTCRINIERQTIIPFDENRVCQICGTPLISERYTCLRCREENYPFSKHRAAFQYKYEIKQLIHKYKFKGYRNIAMLFAYYLSRVYYKHFPYTVLVPVPASPNSKKIRGWDQMEIVIKTMQKKYHIPVASLLKRKKGKQQKDLHKDERKLNLKNSISVSLSKEKKTIPQHVVIVDDIFTTGTTASMCCEALFSKNIGVNGVISIAVD